MLIMDASIGELMGERRNAQSLPRKMVTNKIRDVKELKENEEGYYKNLFGREEEGSIHLSSDMWTETGRLSEEAQTLTRPFAMAELEKALQRDTSSAPGPDGFAVGCYKEFWEQVNEPLLDMFHRLYRGELNLSTKLWANLSHSQNKEANKIKQYRPICLSP